MTILEKLKKIKAMVKIDYYICIFDNRAEYTPDDFNFYISELDEFLEHPLLQRELKNKPKYFYTKGKERICIAFN